MADEKVGGIYYEVAADTSKLLDATKGTNKALDDFTKSANKADAATDSLNAKKTKLASAMESASRAANKERDSMSGLTKVVAAYLSLQTVKSIAQLSDTYQQNASRIKNATSNTEEYEAVQARLLETANGTFRALKEAQEVYLSVSDSLRDLKYNTAEVLDITDSLSYAFVRDAARADQATTAMDAYSKGLMKGKIEADGWASIMAATPSIVKGIAEATGRSTEEIKKLGATGKLSLQALNEGLLISRDESKKLAEEMAVSTQDAVVQLTNAFTVFFGKINEGSKASNVFTDNVALMAQKLQDPEVIAAATNFAAGVVTALNKIIDSAKETVKFVTWMGEEIAARMNGVDMGDSNRMGEQLAKWQKELANFETARNRSAFNPMKWFDGYSTEELDKEIADRKKKIADYRAYLAERAKSGPLPTAKPTATQPPSGPRVRPRVSAVATDSKDAERAAAKAANEEKARAKRALEYINNLKGQLDTLDGITNVQKVLNELQRGSIDLRGKEKADAIAIAEELDRRVKLEKDRQDNLARENATLAAQRQLQAEILGYTMQIAGASMGPEARANMEQRLKLEEQFSERIQQIQDQRREAIAGAQDGDKDRINALYDDTLRIEQEYQKRSLEEYEKFIARKKELDTDWRTGAVRALAEYQEAAANSANLTATVVGNALSGLEGAYEKFARTGKLSFTDLANSIIADLARIAAKQAVSGIASWLGGLIGQYFGGAAASGGGGSQYSLSSGSSGLGLKMPGRANGGPVESGKMYRVNERGAPEVLDVGGSKYLMMGNRSGNVTPVERSGGGAGVGSGVQVNVYNNAGAEVSTQSRQGDDGSQMIDVIIERAVNAVAGDISKGGRVSNAMQGSFGLNRGAATPRFSR